MGPVRIAFAVAVAVAAAVTACSGPAASGPATLAGAHVNAGPASYYLALGDSLSQGVQPDAAGASVETQRGYPDQLYAALRRSHPELRMVKLGCPGETTSTMINGGVFHYPGGSQLAAPGAFLRAHPGHMFLITSGIRANGPQDSARSASPPPMTHHI